MDDLERGVVLQMEELKGSYILVKLPALPAFAAISAIQLATRHPTFPEHLRPWVSRIARLLIKAIAPDPNSPLHKVYMMGWDPAHDYVRDPAPATYKLGETASNGPHIQCLVCNSISFNANDIANRYCAQCQQFHPIEPMRSMMAASAADDQPPDDGGPL